MFKFQIFSKKDVLEKRINEYERKNSEKISNLVREIYSLKTTNKVLENKIESMKRIINYKDKLYKIDSITYKDNKCEVRMRLYQDCNEFNLVMSINSKNLLIIKKVENIGNKVFRIELFDDLNNVSYNRLVDFEDYSSVILSNNCKEEYLYYDTNRW